MIEQLRLQRHHVPRNHGLEHAPLCVIRRTVKRLLSKGCQSLLRRLEAIDGILANRTQIAVLAAQQLRGIRQHPRVSRLGIGIVNVILNRAADAECDIAGLRHSLTEPNLLLRGKVLGGGNLRCLELADVASDLRSDLWDKRGGYGWHGLPHQNRCVETPDSSSSRRRLRAHVLPMSAALPSRLVPSARPG